MNGEKLQPADYQHGYCVYDEIKNESPFRYIAEAYDIQMTSIWNKTEWKIYEEPVKILEPENGQEAWFVDAYGIILSSAGWKSSMDKMIIELGNAFKSKKDAEIYVKYRQAEHRLRKAVWELNEGSAPEFEYGAENCSICLAKNEPVAHTWVELQVNPDWFYFKSIELAKKLAETHKEDLLIYLHGV